MYCARLGRSLDSGTAAAAPLDAARLTRLDAFCCCVPTLGGTATLREDEEAAAESAEDSRLLNVEDAVGASMHHAGSCTAKTSGDSSSTYSSEER
jgi:hypothetical protein